MDPSKINIELTLSKGALALAQVPTAGECADVAGWYYADNVSPTHILLCPATCDAVQTDPMSRIDVVLGCATNVTPPPSIAR